MWFGIKYGSNVEFILVFTQRVFLQVYALRFSPFHKKVTPYFKWVGNWWSKNEYEDALLLNYIVTCTLPRSVCHLWGIFMFSIHIMSYTLHTYSINSPYMTYLGLPPNVLLTKRIAGPKRGFRIWWNLTLPRPSGRQNLGHLPNRI